MINTPFEKVDLQLLIITKLTTSDFKILNLKNKDITDRFCHTCWQVEFVTLDFQNKFESFPDFGLFYGKPYASASLLLLAVLFNVLLSVLSSRRKNLKLVVDRRKHTHTHIYLLFLDDFSFVYVS